MPDRAEALALLESWVENKGLRRHMLAVEAAVRHYARMHDEDEDLWGIAGLIHDLDWEKYPEEHPKRGLSELEARGYPSEIIRAVQAHAPNRTGVEPETLMERVLFACDELSGLVYACCLVRPNGIDDLKPKSVTKKLRDKAFAAGVDRDDVARGVELLGIDRAEHIQNVIDGMRTIADVLEIRAEDRA
ncbi:MAG: HD domain-containing protein [Gemmatimonadetes bacterium]|nr:HD domain-containing protein [Gemmatimonadota bacterium]